MALPTTFLQRPSFDSAGSWTSFDGGELEWDRGIRTRVMALGGSPLSTVLSVAQSHMYFEPANDIAQVRWIRSVNGVEMFELVAVHETRK